MDLNSIYSFKDCLSHPDVIWTEHVYSVSRLAEQFGKSLPGSALADLPVEISNGMLRRIALLHDAGKLCSFFQQYIRGEIKHRSDHTNHALISGLLVYAEIEFWLRESFIPEELRSFLPFMAYLVVRQHHGKLKNPIHLARIDHTEAKVVQDQWEYTDRQGFRHFWEEQGFSLPFEQLESFIAGLPAVFKPKRFLLRLLNKHIHFDLYFLTTIVFSILLDADKSAAGLHALPELPEDLHDDWIDHWHQKQKWDHPQSPFDSLRRDAYLQATKTVIQKVQDRIWNLQLPTGFGKTLTAFSVALKLLKRNQLQRIIYCLPFTSIIDQNFVELQHILHELIGRPPETGLLLKHHHLTDVFYKEDGQEYNSLEAELLMEGWQSRIIVTTFVQLFHTLIGYRNRTLRKFHRLANAVVILDEVQTVPFAYWGLIRKVLAELAKRCHTHILLVTATQPRLFSPGEQIPLVKPDRYYASLKRVRLYNHLQQAISLEKFSSEVLVRSKNKKKIMVVLNTINSALKVFQLLQGERENLFFLSSRVVPGERLRRIRELNEKKEYVLVTTQIVEAGVNLDADILFRDFAPLDSIQQAAGRCNRFNRGKNGEVHIYRLVDGNGRTFASYIYDTALLDLTYRTLVEEVVEEAHFLDLCNRYFSDLANFPQEDSHRLVKAVANLRYTGEEHSIDTFRLIKEDYEKQDVFVEVDEQAAEVWQRYLALDDVQDFWKRREAYLSLKNKLQEYIISVGVRDLRRNPPPQVHGFYYIPQTQLEEYYDIVTGFKTEGEVGIW